MCTMYMQKTSKSFSSTKCCRIFHKNAKLPVDVSTYYVRPRADFYVFWERRLKKRLSKTKLCYFSLVVASPNSKVDSIMTQKCP